MNKKIQISIIMAVYNAEKYIRQAIDSLLDQTMREFEIICVDDGSNDASVSILKQYEARDTRLKVLMNSKKSEGAGAARNFGLKNASGEYVIFLDADDFFETDLLEKAYKKIVETSADVVLFDAYLFNDAYGRDDNFTKFIAGRFLPKESVFTPIENRHQLFQMTMGAAWNMMISLNYIKAKNIQFQEDIFHADDIGFSYLALACASRIGILNEKLVHYRKFIPESQSANLRRAPFSGCQAMLWIKEKLEERDLFDKYSDSFANRALEYILIYLHTTSEPESFKDLFGLLKEKIFPEFGITKLTEENSCFPQLLKERDLILNCTPEEYFVKQFLDESNGTTRKMFLDKGMLIKKIRDKRIILYGAGEQGIVWFSILLRYGISIEKWVDQKWKELGFCVSSPDEIESDGQVMCVIAIESRDVYYSVKDFLKQKGFDNDHIVWIQE